MEYKAWVMLNFEIFFIKINSPTYKKYIGSWKFSEKYEIFENLQGERVLKDQS